VSGDAGGDITPVDALLVIDWLNAHKGQSSQLPGTATPLSNGFVDVNNDGHCTPADALMVIDWLNLGASEGESLAAESDGSGSTSSAAGFVAPAGGSAAEGEAPAEYRSAAEYYARNPIHFRDIAGDDEECLHEDEPHDDHHDHELATAAGIINSGPGLSIATALDSGNSFSSSILVTLGDLFGDFNLPSAVDQALERGLETVTALVGRHQQAIDRVAAEIHEALDLLASEREELDEALDSIADDISSVWAEHHERLRRVIRRGA
jgi:hypothetical protein